MISIIGGHIKTFHSTISIVYSGIEARPKFVISFTISDKFIGHEFLKGKMYIFSLICYFCLCVGTRRYVIDLLFYLIILIVTY